MKILTILVALLIPTTINSALFGKPAAFAAIKPGDKLPFVDLHWGFPPQYVNFPQYCGGRNVIIVGLPGAFTPTAEVPSYVANQDALKELGVEEVIFYCVNDGACMGVWMHKLDLEGTMTQMFGDPSGEFTKACGMDMPSPGLESIGLIGRSKKFAMHVVNNVIKYVAVSEFAGDGYDDNSEAICAPAMIQAIKNENLVNA